MRGESCATMCSGTRLPAGRGRRGCGGVEGTSPSTRSFQLKEHWGIYDEQERNGGGRGRGLFYWNDECREPCRKRV
jgi:hypothetical protein